MAASASAVAASSPARRLDSTDCGKESFIVYSESVFSLEASLGLVEGKGYVIVYFEGSSTSCSAWLLASTQSTTCSVVDMSMAPWVMGIDASLVSFACPTAFAAVACL